MVSVGATRITADGTSRLGVDAEVRFLGDLVAADWLRIAELLSKYRDLPLGTADASVIAAADRLGVNDIATIDRRQFTVVQSTLGAFTLLP